MPTDSEMADLRALAARDALVVDAETALRLELTRIPAPAAVCPCGRSTTAPDAERCRWCVESAG